jgi:hypothetical protein
MAEQEPIVQVGNENLNLLHKQLIEDKYAIPQDVTEFENIFKDPENSKTLFFQLKQDRYAIPEDYDSFVTTFG